MSKGMRDQRGRSHSGKKCPEAQNGGCVYCRTGEYKKEDRRARRGESRRIARSRDERAEGRA